MQSISTNIRAPEENPFFYDLFFKKDKGVGLYLDLVKQFVKDRDLEVVSGLQYDDDAIKMSGIPKVFLVRRNNERFKIRICSSDEESVRINQNISYAYNRGIPVSRSIEAFGPLLLLEYVPGQSVQEISSEDRIKIGNIHSSLNHIVSYSENLKNKLESIFLVSLEALSKLKGVNRYRDIFYQELPENLFPVFDHQDFGLHNLVKNSQGFFVVDEEAFGILPFGYSLHRAMHGRRKYEVCSNEKEVRDYLSCFSKEFSDYYIKTQNFWESVYTIRESARVFVCGNRDLARRLVENGR
jgi:hypothetical protein